MGQPGPMDGAPDAAFVGLNSASAINGEASRVSAGDPEGTNGVGESDGPNGHGLNGNIDPSQHVDDGCNGNEDTEKLKARVCQVEEQLEHISTIIDDLKSLPRHEALILLDQLRRRAHVPRSSEGLGTDAPIEGNSNAALSEVAKQVLSERQSHYSTNGDLQ